MISTGPSGAEERNCQIVLSNVARQFGCEACKQIVSVCSQLARCHTTLKFQKQTVLGHLVLQFAPTRQRIGAQVGEHNAPAA